MNKVSLNKVMLIVLSISCISGVVNAALGDMSIGGASGVMIANDKTSYMNDTESVYGEFHIAYDMGIVQFGSSIGYFERTTDLFDENWSFRNRNSNEDVLAYMPLEVSVNILPFRGDDDDSLVQPYIGVGVGGLIGVGNNDDHFLMVTPRLGLEFLFGGRHVVDLEVAYTAVFDDDDGGYDGVSFYPSNPAYDYDLDYYTVTVAYRFKFLFGEHHKN